MESSGRGERMVRILVYLMAHYNNRYSVTDIMHHLDIPESDLRNVQRDMQALVNLEGGYIQRIIDSGKTYYQVALERANKLVFPDFGDMVLHFVFLQRIANLYPATSSLIEDLTKRITQDLPAKQQDVLKSYSKELNGRILFMGTPPNYDENVSKNMPTILNAIRKKQKVQITYTDNWGTVSTQPRIPLMVAISHGDIYIGCVSRHHPDKTYALKLQRIESVKLLKETFEEDPKVVESLRKRIRTGALLLGDQNPQEEKVVIYFPKYAKNFLKERPYHRSMKMEDAPGDEIRVTMKVEVNELLKQWIMYYGNIATVEQPKKLKQMILETAKSIVNKYEK
ncbi:WYL domain-containing protein [Fibrobacter sp.]|uniref:helix-turn-helix transcriptional regulator n=1 Tax=Fibrobacter sp. TaxID=35828 RepID=UPI0025C17A26|nr:WYL domain-containing protein [Fibrobacter sp.]MBR3070987.1 WYL domain-containing protein [Fibrobacter sp.]